jgi:hypothetical protein
MALQALGGALVYVGFVLVANGLWILGKVNAKDVLMLNLFTGVVTFASSFYSLIVNGSALAWAQGLLFSFTYLWIASNIHRGIQDQRAFGWYCLFVAITAAISGALTLPEALTSTGFTLFEYSYLTFLWWLWAALWASFWVLLVLKRGTTPIAWFTIATGILSYVPAFAYMLRG